MVTIYTTKFNIHTFRTNSDYFPTQHEMTGFYNKRDGVRLLRGTDWIFYIIQVDFGLQIV